VLVGELEIRGRVAPVPVWTITKPEQPAAPVAHVAAEDTAAGRA
jgi:hypothetical protein